MGGVRVRHVVQTGMNMVLGGDSSQMALEIPETLKTNSPGLARSLRRILITACLLPGFCMMSAHAATITPTVFTDEYDTAPNGQCSLREAIQSINGGSDFGGCVATGAYGAGDTVNLRQGTYLLSITGAGNSGGDLDVLADMTINGVAGNLSNGSIIDAQNNFRVIDVHNGLTVAFNDFVVTGGSGSYTNYQAAGINLRNATLTINRCAVVGNTNNDARGAGGVGMSDARTGDLTITDSLISNNTNASIYVGAGVDLNGGVLNITNTTFSGNNGDGPDLFVYGYDNSDTATLAHVTMTDSKAASPYNSWGNIAPAFSNSILNDGCAGAVIDNGYNRFVGSNCDATPASTSVDNISPISFPALALNGGRTRNHAIDNSAAFAVLFDQIPSGSSGCGTTFR